MTTCELSYSPLISQSPDSLPPALQDNFTTAALSIGLIANKPWDVQQGSAEYILMGERLTKIGTWVQKVAAPEKRTNRKERTFIRTSPTWLRIFQSLIFTGLAQLWLSVYWWLVTAALRQSFSPPSRAGISLTRCGERKRGAWGFYNREERETVSQGAPSPDRWLPQMDSVQ